MFRRRHEQLSPVFRHGYPQLHLVQPERAFQRLHAVVATQRHRAPARGTRAADGARGGERRAEQTTQEVRLDAPELSVPRLRRGLGVELLDVVPGGEDGFLELGREHRPAGVRVAFEEIESVAQGGPQLEGHGVHGLAPEPNHRVALASRACERVPLHAHAGVERGLHHGWRHRYEFCQCWYSCDAT